MLSCLLLIYYVTCPLKVYYIWIRGEELDLGKQQLGYFPLMSIAELIS